jgi:hypothetical protein
LNVKNYTLHAINETMGCDLWITQYGDFFSQTHVSLSTVLSYENVKHALGQLDVQALEPCWQFIL